MDYNYNYTRAEKPANTRINKGPTFSFKPNRVDKDAWAIVKRAVTRKPDVSVRARAMGKFAVNPIAVSANQVKYESLL